MRWGRGNTKVEHTLQITDLSLRIAGRLLLDKMLLKLPVVFTCFSGIS
jgi:HD superfamily phosphodiesterase